MDIRKMEDAAMKAYMRDLSQPNGGLPQTTNEIEASEPTVGYVNVNETPEGTVTAAPTTFKRRTDPMLAGLPADFDVDDYKLEQNKRNANNQKSGGSSGGGGTSADKKKEVEPDPGNPSLWCEAKSDDGHTYYWNVKTNGEWK